MAPEPNPIGVLTQAFAAALGGNSETIDPIKLHGAMEEIKIYCAAFKDFPDPLKAARGLPALFEAMQKCDSDAIRFNEHYQVLESAMANILRIWRTMTEATDEPA